MIEEMEHNGADTPLLGAFDKAISAEHTKNRARSTKTNYLQALMRASTEMYHADFTSEELYALQLRIQRYLFRLINEENRSK